MRIASLLLIIFILGSCTSTAKLHRNKVRKAKNKIERLVQKYPELKSSSDTTSIVRDTIVESKVVINTDSVYINGGTIVDTVIQFNVDSTFYAKFEDISVRLEEIGGGQVRANISRTPHYIYYTDTIQYTDTVFVNTINTVKTDIISTEKSFWWSLWDQVSGWIWWVLIIVAILLIMMMTRRLIG